jgi:hypothetical protein
MPISEIVRVMGVVRNTVKAALDSDAPPKYRRVPVGSLVDGFEPRIRELLAAYPMMPATVIAERIGWPYSIRTLSGRVGSCDYYICRRIRRGGRVMSRVRSPQCDFCFRHRGAGGVWHARTAKQLPVLTMVTEYSR